MIIPKSWDHFGQNTSTNGSEVTESGLHQSVDLKISGTFMIKSPVVRRNHKHSLTRSAERWQMEADRRLKQRNNRQLEPKG